MKNLRLFSIFVFCLWFIAFGCAPSNEETPNATLSAKTSTPTFTPTSTPTQPTSTPLPTPVYIEGLSEIPSGKLFFLAVDAFTDCSPECDCPAVEPVPWPFNEHNGEIGFTKTLLLDGGYYKEWVAIDSDMPMIGIFTYYDVASRSEAHIIQELPFAPYEYGQYVIHAVDEQGALVVEGFWQTKLLQPGEGWNIKVPHDPIGDCQMTSKFSLHNYGLLTKEQIH